MTQNPSPDLFVRSDGHPMAFLMGPTGIERQQIKRLVESGGGVILSQPTLAYRDYMIRLLVRTEIPIKKDQDMFDYKYILDCVERNELLANLIEYKITSHVPSPFEPYNPLDVLLGNLKWSDVPKKPVGERVSDIEDDEVGEDMRRSFEVEYRHHKANRLPYSKKEQQEIVSWVVKYSAFKLLKGNLVWQRMEEARVGSGRSWQSLKEHFRKVVIGRIHTYGLTRTVIDYFKVGMGMQEEFATSGTECETREEAEARIKLMGIRSLRSRTKNRNSPGSVNRSRSSSHSPPPSDLNRRKVTRGKVSKVPADQFDLTPNSSAESDGLVPPPPRNRMSTEDRETGSSGAQEKVIAGNLPVARKENLSNLLRERNENLSTRTKSKASVTSSSYKTAQSVTEECPKLVDVGQDAELEQLLDQSILPSHLGDKFTSSGSEEEVRTVHGKKRKLFSDTYLDSLAEEEEDMFALTPVKRRGKNKSRLQITKELPSTEEFLEGLKEAASVELSRENSMDDIEGGVTSTQKGLDISGDVNNDQHVSDEVFDDDTEINLVISESGGSAEVPVAEADKPFPVPPTSPESLNLLDPGPTLDPSTYTLSQSVMDMEKIPVIGPESQNVGEVQEIDIEEPVDTQGLVDAFNSIGEDLPGLRPKSRQGLLTPVSTPPARADFAEVVESSFPDEVSDNPPKDNQVLNNPPRGSRNSSEPQSSHTKVGRPLPALRRSLAPAEPIKQVSKTVNRRNKSQDNDDVFDFSDHEDGLDELEIDEAAAPAKSKGRKTKNIWRVPKSGPYWDSLRRRGEDGGKSQRGVKRRAVEASVGLTKGGEALLVVAGLPSDVDSEDIELVRTNGEGRGVSRFDRRILDSSSDHSSNDTDEQNSDKVDDVVRRLRDKTLTSRGKDGVDNPRPGPSRERGVGEENQGGVRPKYKLKIVTIGKENLGMSKSKAGRFQRDGEFSDKFRLPYTRREEEAIVRYFTENGGFKLRKGNKVWTQMEESGICPGRTWQSMKQRWEKYISKSLDKFGVTEEELEERDVREGSETGDDDETDMSLDISTRGFRSGANYYTTSDDQKILDYIEQNKRFPDLGGRALWQMMEKRGVVPGRTWNSLKERFRKVIMKKIRTYGLSEETVSKFLARSHVNRLNTV